MWQGVRGIPAIERAIKVVPNNQPSSLEVSYTDSNGQSVLIKPKQDLLGVCGDSIKAISKYSQLFCDNIRSCTFNTLTTKAF